jgi:hypothetical protein
MDLNNFTFALDYTRKREHREHFTMVSANTQTERERERERERDRSTWEIGMLVKIIAT